MHIVAMLECAQRPPDGTSGGRLPEAPEPSGHSIRSIPTDVDVPVSGSTTRPPRHHAAVHLEPLIGSLPRGTFEIRSARPLDEVRVGSLSYRSGRVEPGALFFCVPGGRADGHAFAPEAVRAGASALVVERWLDLDHRTVAQVRVPSVRRAMGPVSAGFFGHPSDRLRVIGVTGTNGKTTSTYLLESVFDAAGMRAGVIGTTGVRIAGRSVPFDRTTPEAPDLQRLLGEMVEDGVDAVAMEVSSHGLDQHRVDGTRYRCAVFTNLSQDHLDYHADMEDYFGAKARLFTPELADVGAISIDDAAGRRMAQGATIPVVTFGLDPAAQVRATDVDISGDGIRFRVGSLHVRSRLRSLHNVANCVGVVAAARQLELDDDAIAEGLASRHVIPGRLEPIEAGQPFQAFVDYAHTPDSLAIVLRAVRPLTAGRVIVVFGCGGDRDRSKRPLMGEAATSNAELSIVTSDNPRSEDPMAIIRSIIPGAERGGGAFVVEPDRRAAIRMAVSEAAPGDVVVIAGKGHETGQEFAGHTAAFDDRVVAAEEIAKLGPAAGRENER
jgi:UDP-N-acetylmuramoyl-L-alanyl-D-glutamate--2,6-diaminopimelate ligase